MFYITYYAKKHKNFITRKGQYDKPDGTKGKSFVSKNGTPCLVYWDLDNDGWRMAVRRNEGAYMSSSHVWCHGPLCHTYTDNRPGTRL